MKFFSISKRFSANYQSGQAGSDFIIVLIIVMAIGLVWMSTGGPERFKQRGGTKMSFFTQPMMPEIPTASSSFNQITSSKDRNNFTNSQNKIKSDKSGALKSKWSGKIRLERGSAGMEEYTMNEYVRIVADWSNKEPINITGWKLGNGGRFTGQVEYLTIPTGTKYFSVVNPGKQVPILLEKGQSAVVTVGHPVSEDPFPVRISFQVNKCSGYLRNLGTLKFRPDLPRSCPSIDNEPGVETVDDTCLNYFRRMGTCTNFRFDKLGRLEYINNRYVLNEVNYDLPPSQCVAYAKAHFGYEQCLVNHKNDKDFLTNEWRVFLNMSRRFWYSSRDRITLYDSEGKLVDQINIP